MPIKKKITNTSIKALTAARVIQYVDKGNWYNLLNDHLGGECTGKVREWLSTKQICEVINAATSKGNVIGKALNQLIKYAKLEKKMPNGLNRYRSSSNVILLST